MCYLVAVSRGSYFKTLIDSYSLLLEQHGMAKSPIQYFNDVELKQKRIDHKYYLSR
jgi:hypothetical protein